MARLCTRVWCTSIKYKFSSTLEITGLKTPEPHIKTPPQNWHHELTTHYRKQTYLSLIRGDIPNHNFSHPLYKENTTYVFELDSDHLAMSWIPSKHLLATENTSHGRIDSVRLRPGPIRLVRPCPTATQHPAARTTMRQCFRDHRSHGPYPPIPPPPPIPITTTHSCPTHLPLHAQSSSVQSTHPNFSINRDISLRPNSIPPHYDPLHPASAFHQQGGVKTHHTDQTHCFSPRAP